MNRKQLIKKLDKVVSEVVRRAYSRDGIATCYTCGKQAPWQEMDCGHYIKRRFLNTRWEIDNLRVQCPECLTGDAELYLWNFRPIRQDHVKVGDLILARNPMSQGVMIVEITRLEKKKSQTFRRRCYGAKIEASLNHRVETKQGFQLLRKCKEQDIIMVWKK